MHLSLITYNLYFNRAHDHVPELMQKCNPDFFCVQEINTTDQQLQSLEVGPYKLAEYANSFIKHGKNWGNATYYNADRFELVSAKTTDLPQSLYDVMVFLLQFLHNARTTVETVFKDKQTGTLVRVYNVHLSHITSTKHRLAQLATSINELGLENMEKERVLIAGDFNCYHGKQAMGEFFQQWNLEEATSNIYMTFNHKKFGISVMKGKLDYILHRNLRNIETVRIEPTQSDHYPIMGRFELL